MNNYKEYYRKWPLIILFSFLLVVPLSELYCQDKVILVKPMFNTANGKWAELDQVATGIQNCLKSNLEDLSYRCMTENWQDWDFSDDPSVRIRKANQYGAKYIISTKEIKYISSSNPAEKGYEIDFVVEELKANGALVKVEWYDSKFIVYNLSERTYEKVAENVSEEFNFFHINGHFKPRIQITDYAKIPDDISIEYESDFNDWLEELLQSKFQAYVFYDDERIYPGTCDNKITGSFNRETATDQKPVKLIVILQVDDEKEKSKGFQILNGSEKYLSDDDVDRLVQEIKSKLEELINNE
jgi:hypothetical protein